MKRNEVWTKMARNKLPDKILVIKDCTFILPPDFNGSLEDAFEEFLKYREKNLNKAKNVDPQNFFSTFDLLLHGQNQRVCGHYTMYELRDGKYVPVDATGVPIDVDSL